MIEIEVEMDSDVLAAEAASSAVRELFIHLGQTHRSYNCFFFLSFNGNWNFHLRITVQLQERISEQIQQIMEIENLEEASVS